MPTYVYQCKKCEKRFEIEQRIVEDALLECLCENKGEVKRIIQPVGISFKGSGFYVNDAAKPAPQSTPATESSGSGEEASDTKAETKPSTAASSEESTTTDTTTTNSDTPVISEPIKSSPSDLP